MTALLPQSCPCFKYSHVMYKYICYLDVSIPKTEITEAPSHVDWLLGKKNAVWYVLCPQWSESKNEILGFYLTNHHTIG